MRPRRCAPIVESGYRYDSPLYVQALDGVRVVEHQICGEKQSIPRSSGCRPRELSSRISGRASKIRCSTSYRPSILPVHKGPLTPAQVAVHVPLT